MSWSLFWRLFINLYQKFAIFFQTMLWSYNIAVFWIKNDIFRQFLKSQQEADGRKHQDEGGSTSGHSWPANIDTATAFTAWIVAVHAAAGVTRHSGLGLRDHQSHPASLFEPGVNIMILYLNILAEKIVKSIVNCNSKYVQQ
jgi:hypothetical protein